MAVWQTQDIVVVGKVLIALLLVGGGILAIVKGAGLFRDGVGLKGANLEVNVFQGIKIATSSVGGALMLTAGLWGWLASKSLPEYASGNGIIKISDFEVPSSHIVNFALDSSSLSDSDAQKLEAIAGEFMRSKKRYFMVSVPANNEGSLGNKTELASQRLQTIIEDLKKRGVTANWLSGAYMATDPALMSVKAVVKLVPDTEG